MDITRFAMKLYKYLWKMKLKLQFHLNGVFANHPLQARKLDVYFELEEKLMSKQTLDKSLMDVISDPDAGLPEDKMRLFIIFYICSQAVPEVRLTFRLPTVINPIERFHVTSCCPPTWLLL